MNIVDIGLGQRICCYSTVEDSYAMEIEKEEEPVIRDTMNGDKGVCDDVSDSRMELEPNEQKVELAPMTTPLFHRSPVFFVEGPSSLVEVRQPHKQPHEAHQKKPRPPKGQEMNLEEKQQLPSTREHPPLVLSPQQPSASQQKPRKQKKQPDQARQLQIDVFHILGTSPICPSEQKRPGIHASK